MAEEANTVYLVDQKTRKELADRFSVAVLNAEQDSRLANVRHAGFNMAVMLSANCPPSRELSLALTKLEEATMWAVKSIARNESEPDE